MMKKEMLKHQSISYLIKLERWELIRWKRRLELLNETTDDLWLIREVLKNKIEKPKSNTEYGIFTKFIKSHTGTNIK